MPKILIIEDDGNINRMLQEALTAEGYDCVGAYSGTEGMLRLEQETYELVLLDLMLPGLSGKEVLQRGKALTQAPFFVLSARDELDTKVDLLTLGADDYMTKPFELKELKARILVRLRDRRNTAAPEGVPLVYRQLRLDPESHEVTLAGRALSLTLQEYKILELLLLRPEKVFSKQEIYQYAWDDYYIGEDKTINVHISNIRQKMKRVTEDEYIETIWGIGFRMSKKPAESASPE